MCIALSIVSIYDKDPTERWNAEYPDIINPEERKYTIDSAI